MTGDAGPACSPIPGTRAELLGKLEGAVDLLAKSGVDPEPQALLPFPGGGRARLIEAGESVDSAALPSTELDALGGHPLAAPVA